VGEPDLAAERLDVYDTGRGWSSPDHGDLTVPDGWEFLPRGDGAVTRAVKAAGTYWTAWLPKDRHRPHRRLLGLWAPAATIDAARTAADLSPPRRNDRDTTRWRRDLTDAVIAFLDFRPEHAGLARRIATEAATRADPPTKISLSERAELATRAAIRHLHTDYQETIDTLAASGYWDDDRLYQQARQKAEDAVDEFLARHRRAV
jgi:hypothetical protein